jgi:hypothetical protein
MRAKIEFTVAGTLGRVSFLISGSFAQQHAQPSSAQTIIRVQSPLVLVDVISQNPKNGLPVRDLKKEDFRVFDNGNEIPIASFDSGARNDTRPYNLSGLW